MSVQFHRGITQALRARMQLMGIQLEEIDAQRALVGLSLFRGQPQEWLDAQVFDILSPPNHQDLIKEWHEEHPGQSGFPPTFAQVVLERLSKIDRSDPGETIDELIAIAQTELLFG